jgi:hypothetical protein
MVRRSALIPLVLLATFACGPRIRGSRSARARSTTTATTPTGRTAPRGTVTGAPTVTQTAPPPTATLPVPTTTAPPPPTTTAPPPPTATVDPTPIADDLVPACRFNCDALKNACAADDASGCYRLCEEYDRTLARGCRGLMAAYFRCLSWTASCDGGQPRSDVSKCASDKAALDACKG